MEIKMTVPSTKEIKIKPKFNVWDTIKIQYNEFITWVSNVLSIEIDNEWNIAYLIPTGGSNSWYREELCSSI